MSKAKSAAPKSEVVKTDPKRDATLRNQIRRLAKHVRLFPQDQAAADTLKALKSGQASTPRKAAKEPGKSHIVRLVFRDCIDRLELTHDANGNPFRDAEGKAVKRYEDRISERVGVREMLFNEQKAKVKGILKFHQGLKTPAKKLRFEYSGNELTMGEAVSAIVSPNAVKLAGRNKINLTGKPRDPKPFDGKPGRKITVGEAFLQILNYKPNRIRPVGAPPRGQVPAAKVEA